MVPPWFQACINWKIGCYLTTSIPAIHFFYGNVIISLEAIHYVKRTVFILQDLLQGSIIVSSLWLIRGNLKVTAFIWGKQWKASPALIKVPIYSTELVALISACSHQSFMVTAQKWSFPWRISSVNVTRSAGGL